MNRYDATTDMHSVYSNAYMTGQTDMSMTDANDTVRRVDDLSDSDEDIKSNATKVIRKTDSRSQSQAPNMMGLT